jgi:regulator of cell morphogenesis and NO signaling
MAATLERTIGELVAERPARARVFEGFKIDYCCGGNKALADACRAKGVDPHVVLKMIAIADDAGPREERDWTKATITELCDDVEATHHAYLKRELPRLEFMARKVAGRHGEHHPELLEIRDVFLHAKDELEQHMAKEEQVLFPTCRRLDRGEVGFGCGGGGSVQNPIQVMIREHEDAGDALARLRELTDGFTPPVDACNTYRAYFEGLAAFEADMHRHVHKENSVLFPKAIEAERHLR